jgi:hypothetical protein
MNFKGGRCSHENRDNFYLHNNPLMQMSMKMNKFSQVFLETEY